MAYVSSKLLRPVLAIKRRIFCCLALAIVQGSICLLFFLSTLSWGSASPFWFDDIEYLSPLPKSVAEAAVNWVASSFLRRGHLGEAPPQLLADDTPRIVFLSVSDGLSQAQVALGSGLGAGPAVRNAVSRMSKVLRNGYNPRWVKMDFVRDVIRLNNISLEQPFHMDKSLFGLAFDRESCIAFLPEELMAQNLIDQNQYVKLGNITEYIKKQPARSGANQQGFTVSPDRMYRFSTNAFFIDCGAVYPLFRGHRLWEQVSKADLQKAAIEGGRYLIRSVLPNGRFVYVYQSRQDFVPERYNIIRHAGTIYSIIELYRVTGDPQLIRAGKQAVRYLLGSIHHCTTRLGPGNCVVEGGYTKLGANALAAVALAEYMKATGEREHLSVLLGLGKWILSAQGGTGEFVNQRQAYPEGPPEDFRSKYYPGEALLALLRINTVNPDNRWLDAAEAGARFLIDVRDKTLSNAELYHDHWLMYALKELYPQRPNSLFLNHTLRLAWAIVERQNRHPQFQDWLGSFYLPPRSTPTATRMEGLSAAYWLAKDSGDTRTARVILHALWRGIKFQLRTQFWPESAMYLINPQRALGGFRRSLTDFDIRIDYVQHNISSLLGLYRIADSQ